MNHLIVFVVLFFSQFSFAAHGCWERCGMRCQDNPYISCLNLCIDRECSPSFLKVKEKLNMSFKERKQSGYEKTKN